ncbi:unnamed protein product [Ilex paraguariensis]|uniref:Uncharacterized protein n=1 Tax=Ilex paraguariensis TaxID=185542 RepID=A0ABC8SQI5_9AQUA
MGLGKPLTQIPIGKRQLLHPHSLPHRATKVLRHPEDTELEGIEELLVRNGGAPREFRLPLTALSIGISTLRTYSWTGSLFWLLLWFRILGIWVELNSFTLPEPIGIIDLPPLHSAYWLCVSSSVVTSYMGTEKEKRMQSTSSTSPCAHFRAAYHNCFNRWYSEKFVKGHWDKEECVSEWQKYRECLSQHMDDKYLSRLLEAEGMVDFTTQAQFRRPAGVSK